MSQRHEYAADAKDVTEGILKWWLPEGQLEWGKEDGQQALDSLISNGWLTEREAALSQKIYGMNKDQLEEIRDFLKGNDSRRE
jgi:hypothetical protein